MIILRLPPPSFHGRERWIGRRTRGTFLVSCPAMSCPRLPARAARSKTSSRLIPKGPPFGADSRSQHRRGRPVSRGRPPGSPLVFGSNLLSGDGLHARLRGQAQKVAARIISLRRVQQAGKPANRRENIG